MNGTGKKYVSVTISGGFALLFVLPIDSTLIPGPDSLKKCPGKGAYLLPVNTERVAWVFWSEMKFLPLKFSTENK